MVDYFFLPFVKCEQIEYKLYTYIKSGACADVKLTKTMSSNCSFLYLQRTTLVAFLFYFIIFIGPASHYYRPPPSFSKCLWLPSAQKCEINPVHWSNIRPACQDSRGPVPSNFFLLFYLFSILTTKVVTSHMRFRKLYRAGSHWAKSQRKFVVPVNKSLIAKWRSVG